MQSSYKVWRKEVNCTKPSPSVSIPWCVCVCAYVYVCIATKQPSLKLKTWAKQLSGYLPLVFTLPPSQSVKFLLEGKHSSLPCQSDIDDKEKFYKIDRRRLFKDVFYVS
jgi:hypothetical protein